MSRDTKLLGPSEAAMRLGVTIDTVRRWMSEGQLTEHRTAGGHRRVDSAEVEAMRSRPSAQSSRIEVPRAPRRTTTRKVGYARIHPVAPTQDLEAQRQRLREHGCHEVVAERASGLTDTRAGLHEALRWIQSGEADELVVVAEDRIGWFMTSLVREMLTTAGAGLTVLEASGLASREELRAELLAGAAVFVERLYGTSSPNADRLLSQLEAAAQDP